MSSSAAGRAKNQWPDHIEVPVNDWIFTVNQLNNSPSLKNDRMTKDSETSKLEKLISFIFVLTNTPPVVFLAEIYLRRYFQRSPLSNDRQDLYVVTTCVFLSARTLELHYPMEKLIRRALEKVQGSQGQSKSNKEYYEWKDNLLRQEMIVMEKLCCDFILFEPFSEFELSYGVAQPQNPFENVMDSEEVMRFWNAIRYREKNGGLYGEYTRRHTLWGGQDIFLLNSIEDVSIAILVYCTAKFQLTFPRNYFKTRNITISHEKLYSLINSLLQLPSSSHPTLHYVDRALSENKDIVGGEFDFGAETEHNDNRARDGQLTASESNGVLSTHESQNYAFNGGLTPGTPDHERGRTDYSLGGLTARSTMDHRTPRDSQATDHRNTPLVSSAGVPVDLKTETTTSTTQPQQHQTLDVPVHHLAPIMNSPLPPVFGSSHAKSPSHISMIKAGPAIPKLAPVIPKKEVTPKPVLSPVLPPSSFPRTPISPSTKRIASLNSSPKRTELKNSDSLGRMKGREFPLVDEITRGDSDGPQKKSARYTSRSTPKSATAAAAAASVPVNASKKISRNILSSSEKTITKSKTSAPPISMPKNTEAPLKKEGRMSQKKPQPQIMQAADPPLPKGTRGSRGSKGSKGMSSPAVTSRTTNSRLKRPATDPGRMAGGEPLTEEEQRRVKILLDKIELTEKDRVELGLPVQD